MKRTILGACCVLIALIGCGKQVDVEKEKAELTRIHKSSREAHFRTDAKALLSHSADPLISVSSGKIDRISLADQEKFFTEYFRNAVYSEWDDLEPPIIQISKDGSMAWMIERVKVHRTQQTPDGQKSDVRFVCAFTSVYEKGPSGWRMVCVTSTFEIPSRN